MSRIKVDTNAYDHITRQLSRLSANMDASASSLRSCLVQVTTSVPKGVGARPRLSQAMRALRQVTNTTNDLVRSVKLAVQTFEVCEKSLIAGTHDSRQQGNVWDNCPFLHALDDVLDWLGIDKYGRNYQDPGIEREKAADAAMKLSLMHLLAEKGFTEADWRAATPKQRQAMLNNLLQRIMGIFGVNIKPKIHFFSEPSDADGYITYGYYQNSQRLVAINTETMSENSYQKNINTLVHEMRHAYQHAAVRDPDSFVVSRETIETWEDNFDNYKTTERDGYQAYRDQAIEVDARAMAEGVL